MPLGEKSASVIQSVCPSRLFNYLYSLISHILTVLSHELETNYFPSVEKFTLVIRSVCPSN